MAYEARIYRILIASPSDVSEERELVTQCIQEWNDLHSAERKVVLLPLRWETHGRPEYGKRPQEIINTTVVDHCDLLIGIFWTRIGTAAGGSRSGTVEEIERVAKAGKPVMLYFSKAKVEPEKLDLEQLAKLNEFKKMTLPNALVEHYGNAVEFKDKISRHLEMKVREFISESASEKNGEPAQTSSVVADLTIELIDPDSGKRVGTSLKLEGDYLDLPKLSEIPDYEKTGETTASGVALPLLANIANKDFYREGVVQVFQRSLLKPVKFALQNVGVIGIRDIHIDLEILCNDAEVYFIEADSMITAARTSAGVWSVGLNAQPNLERIITRSKSWLTSIEIDSIQPKRSIESKLVGYLGVTQSAKVLIKATIYGDCFPDPRRKDLELDFRVKKLKYTAMDIVTHLRKDEPGAENT